MVNFYILNDDEIENEIKRLNYLLKITYNKKEKERLEETIRVGKAVRRKRRKLIRHTASPITSENAVNQYLKSKNNEANNKTEALDVEKTEVVSKCHMCEKEYSDLFQHYKKQHKRFLKLNRHIKSITTPLSNFSRGWTRTRRSSDWYKNFVFTCNKCMIRFAYGSNICSCPICGDRLITPEIGKGKIEYRPSPDQKKAWKNNLKKAREKRSEIAEKSRVISIKHIPPMMQKVHQE